MTDFNNFSDFSELEFANNTDPRCAVTLILDCSSSMAEPFPGETSTPLERLNAGLDVLVSELHKDPLAKRRVEVSVVSFGSDVTPATEFATVDNLVLPTLVPSGVTSMGRAIEVALDAIEARKKVYKENGIQYFKPWCLLISDGLPTDDITSASARIKEAETNKKLSFFAVGVEGADLEILSSLSNRSAMKLQGLKFNELFQWLSASQSAVSASNPGDGGVKLPSPAGWAEIDV